jgi:hypothetical protein
VGPVILKRAAGGLRRDMTFASLFFYSQMLALWQEDGRKQQKYSAKRTAKPCILSPDHVDKEWHL